MLPDDWVAYDFDRDINLGNIIYEILPFCACIYAFIRYYKPGNPISFALSVYFCLYVIPSNSCMSVSNYSLVYYLSINLFNFFLLWFAGLSSEFSDNNPSVTTNEFALGSNLKLQNTLRYVTLFTCAGVILYVYYLRGSISLSGIFTDDIYDTRAMVADLFMQNVGGAIAYLMLIWSAFYGSMLIIGLYLSLKNKHYFDTALCVFAYLLLFAFEMQKSILFKPVIAIFVYILYKHRKITSIEKTFIFGFLCLQLVSLLEFHLQQESIVFSVVLRRMAYMPQYLSHAYYDFFNSHDKIWLTRDFFQLEKLVRIIYPGSYDHGAVTIISENCFPAIPSPNTGLFAEAFSQLGYIGIFVLPIIYALILKLFLKYSIIFGKGASHVLMASFILSIINIQVLAPRGILILILFMLISIYVKKKSY